MVSKQDLGTTSHEPPSSAMESYRLSNPTAESLLDMMADSGPVCSEEGWTDKHGLDLKSPRTAVIPEIMSIQVSTTASPFGSLDVPRGSKQYMILQHVHILQSHDAAKLWRPSTHHVDIWIPLGFSVRFVAAWSDLRRGPSSRYWTWTTAAMLRWRLTRRW